MKFGLEKRVNYKIKVINLPLEAFHHQKSNTVAMFGLNVFVHASPHDLSTADTTVWHQSEIR